MDEGVVYSPNARDIAEWFICPKCKTKTIETDVLLPEGREVTQRVWCHRCNTHWTEIYVAERREFDEQEES